MVECIKCGVEDNKALLFDAISKKGIVKICRKCNVEEELPLIKQAKEEPLIEKKKGVYERLARYAGLDGEAHRKKFVPNEKEELLRKQETSLKDLVDKNFRKKIPEKPTPREDMIYNFHWIIMRARRSRKMTQSQFAREIGESEEAIRTIEQGFLPEDSNSLILKIENFLGIRIRKNMSKENAYSDEFDFSKSLIKKEFQEKGTFDPLTTKSLTIEDLKGMENEKKSNKNENFPDPFSKDDERLLREETDLTEEEIERIIYGH